MCKSLSPIGIDREREKKTFTDGYNKRVEFDLFGVCLCARMCEHTESTYVSVSQVASLPPPTKTFRAKRFALDSMHSICICVYMREESQAISLKYPKSRKMIFEKMKTACNCIPGVKILSLSLTTFLYIYCSCNLLTAYQIIINENEIKVSTYEAKIAYFFACVKNVLLEFNKSNFPTFFMINISSVKSKHTPVTTAKCLQKHAIAETEF